MIAPYKLGWLMGCTLVGAIAACGSDEGGTEKDAATPSDAGHDAATGIIDSGLSFDSGLHDAGPPDAGLEQDGAFASNYFTVNLTTSAEAPPCANAGSAATGTATFWIADPGNTEYSVIAPALGWLNLSSPVTGAHIHYGASGVNGPVVLPFPTPVQHGNVYFSAQDYLAAPGAPATYEAFKTALRDGTAYVNVHTELCPGGEVRGQIDLP